MIGGHKRKSAEPCMTSVMRIKGSILLHQKFLGVREGRAIILKVERTKKVKNHCPVRSIL